MDEGAGMQDCVHQAAGDSSRALRAVTVGEPWVHVSQRWPEPDGEQVFVGINMAGFVGAFNAIETGRREVDCYYETAEEIVDVMSCLEWWAPLAHPLSGASSPMDAAPATGRSVPSEAREATSHSSGPDVVTEAADLLEALALTEPLSAAAYQDTLRLAAGLRRMGRL